MRNERCERLMWEIGLAAIPHDEMVQRDVVRRKSTTKQRHAAGAGIVRDLNVWRQIDENTESGVCQEAIVTGAPPIITVDHSKERIASILGEAFLDVLQRDVSRSQTVARHACAL